MQEKILDIHMDSIDVMIGQDWMAPAATWWGPETVMDDEVV